MTVLKTSAQDAVLDSTHRFPYIWNLADLENIKKNGLSVFSCFSCGGGSTMGYKLAGYDVIGNLEIDPDMNRLYKINQHPRFNYQMDIRDFNKLGEYPEELKNLDILDGSPPCSVFSVLGGARKRLGERKNISRRPEQATAR